MFIFVMIINVVANAFKALVSSVSEFKPFLMNALKNAFANKIKVEIAKIKQLQIQKIVDIEEKLPQRDLDFTNINDLSMSSNTDIKVQDINTP